MRCLLAAIAPLRAAHPHFPQATQGAWSQRIRNEHHAHAAPRTALFFPVFHAAAGHHRYPATTVDLNWTELNTTLTWKNNYWLSLGWSPQALGTRQDGLYSQLGARLPLTDTLRMEALAGYYRLQDAPGGGYAHGQLSAIWALAAPLELRLSAHTTDQHARELLGDDYAGSRWEVALQGSF